MERAGHFKDFIREERERGVDLKDFENKKTFRSFTFLIFHYLKLKILSIQNFFL